ncbi:unnamed protein product [Ceratitis capitata]|uniref:(Mediterranean fruit fly) hypothetical protein n=1 Tax=Ceratitis capitata TaxID=7213 RepID=A0A811UIG9_CERCA|nr:unnamed protein product [Ceratitis capitata]
MGKDSHALMPLYRLNFFLASFPKFVVLMNSIDCDGPTKFNPINQLTGGRGMGITQDPRAAATLHAAKIAHLSAMERALKLAIFTNTSAIGLSKEQNSKGIILMQATDNASQAKDVKTYDLIEDGDLNEKKSPNA